MHPGYSRDWSDSIYPGDIGEDSYESVLALRGELKDNKVVAMTLCHCTMYQCLIFFLQSTIIIVSIKFTGI